MSDMLDVRRLIFMKTSYDMILGAKECGFALNYLAELTNVLLYLP